MNLHTLHIINDRLQAALREEDLDRIVMVCGEMAQETFNVSQRADKRARLGLPQEIPDNPSYDVAPEPWATVRACIIGEIRRFADDGVPVGDFLQAVLCNDLREAFGRADSDNRANLFGIVAYCWNKIPSECWGTREKVKAWLEFKAKTKEAFLPTLIPAPDELDD